MIRLVFIVLFVIPLLSAAQSSPPAKPLPELTYITPQTTQKQLDSITAVLKQHALYLSFDTIAYDANKRIKQISGSLETKNEYFPISSDNFKGITIISRGDTIAVIMGILPKQK